MGRQLLAHLRVNFIFYRRNNLLLLMVLLVLGLGTLSFIPSLLFESSTLKFNLIRNLFRQLDGMATVITAGLGLLTVSHHLRNRCLKMVVTKPCLPDTWLLSVFLSAIIATAIVYLIIFLIATALFLVWGIPFQGGLPFLALMGFLQAVVIISYITMLTVMLHPVMAVLVTVFFQDAMFRQLMTMAQAGARTSADSLQRSFLGLIEKALSGVYLVLPSFGPFSDRLRAVYSSYRVPTSSWQYLSLSFAYAAIISVFFYLVGDWALRRKRLT